MTSTAMSLGMINRRTKHSPNKKTTSLDHAPLASPDLAHAPESGASLGKRKRKSRHFRLGQVLRVPPSPRCMTLAVALVVIVWLVMVVGMSWATTRRHEQAQHRHRIPPSQLTPHPRVVRLDGMADFKPADSAATDDDDTASKHHHKAQAMEVLPASLGSSRDYKRGEKDSWETATCKAMHPWQTQTFLNCNSIHEVDMTVGSVDKQEDDASPLLINNGFWRDVWVLRDVVVDEHDNNNQQQGEQKLVMKTMRWPHNVTQRNFDRNRRDAMVMERLTQSPWILDTYGFCGNTGFSEFAGGGDLATTIWTESAKDKSALKAASMTPKEQLHIATQAAIGLAALHNFDEEGQASVAHTDISPGQFVKVGNRFKLQDFNRARFLTWNQWLHKPCTYTIKKNPGKNRSPEEYALAPLTEKVDIYSLGNIFYMLLQKEWPFYSDSTKKARSQVKKGYRPTFYEDVWNSQDPYDKALKQAMFLCHEQEIGDRASARKVVDYLKEQMEKLDPGVLASWGEQPP